jgi:hypothetical protein
VLGDISLLNEAVGPQPPHKVVFINQVTGAFDQSNQSFGGLGRERNGFAVEKEKTFVRVEADGAKLVEMPCFLRHRARQELFKVFSQFRKDLVTVTTLRCSAE